MKDTDVQLIRKVLAILVLNVDSSSAWGFDCMRAINKLSCFEKVDK